MPADSSNNSMDFRLPYIDDLDNAITRLADHLTVVDIEEVSIGDAFGRVLAEPLLADRDSPPTHVSAMDGYAIRIEDLHSQPMEVKATAVAGAAPSELQPGTAIKIFTGAPIPAAADTIIAREQTSEYPGWVVIQQPPDSVQKGQHVRWQGENITAASTVLDPGYEVNSTVMAAVATFGAPKVRVRRKVRVAVVNTGDELVAPGDTAAAWQIRDSNGPLLKSWLATMRWVKVVTRTRVPDDFSVIREHVKSLLDQCDAILITGGMSAGDTDHVPNAIGSLGGVTAFHRMGIRPGKPVFGAHLSNKLILGLPGNPISTAVTSRVFGNPLLDRLGGKRLADPLPLVELSESDDKQLPLIWFRLVEIGPLGHARLLPNQGSGDVAALARSSGFVTIPAGATGTGPWQFTGW